MFKQIPLKAIPNQDMSIIFGDDSWDIAVRLASGVMSVSLSLNGVAVVENIRAVAGSFIIPAKYQEAGNFIFITSASQLPDYRLFGITQSLVYASADELTILRAKLQPPITSDYFNPAAALPLRFKPQGYILS